MSFTGSVQAVIRGDLVNAGDLSSGKDILRTTLEDLFTDGTGLNQANNQFSDRRTLTTGANESLDLAGGLTNAFGVTLTFTKIKAIIIQALSTNTTDLTVSRPANGLPFFAASGDALVLRPGGIFVLTDPSAAGITVTAGTGDLLNIANAAGASAFYDIIIFGTT